MTLRSLEVFVKVAETGKMSAAAKNLYISQSSVSQAIAEIENEYHVLLFERIRKQLVLTPVGQKLLDQARQTLNYYKSVDDWLKQCSNDRFIKVGATITVGSSVLSSIMRRLEDERPNLETHVYIGNTVNIEERILNSDLDVALIEGNVHNKNIDLRIAMDDYMVIICGKDHRFYGRDSVTIEELANENFILREHGSGTRAQLEDLLNTRQIPYKCVWECYNAEPIKRAVIDGHGISYISERLVHSECENKQIWACNIEGISTLRHFSIISLKGKVQTEAHETFIRIVDDYALQERKKRHINAKTHLVDIK